MQDRQVVLDARSQCHTVDKPTKQTEAWPLCVIMQTQQPYRWQLCRQYNTLLNLGSKLQQCLQQQQLCMLLHCCAWLKSLTHLLDFVECFLLCILGFAPGVLSKLLGSSKVIRDQDVVKDGPGLDLPQLKTYKLEVLVPVQLIIMLVLGVINLRCFPDALVLGVVDPVAMMQGMRRGYRSQLPIHNGERQQAGSSQVSQTTANINCCNTHMLDTSNSDFHHLTTLATTRHVLLPGRCVPVQSSATLTSLVPTRPCILG